MTLNFQTQTSLELSLRSLSPAIQQSILSKLRFGRSASVANGRVLLFDWTGAYSDSAGTVSVANTGVATLTNTAVAPTIRVPSDDTISAPTTTMKPLALEVFLISQPAVAGQSRDAELTVTLNKTGPAVLASSTLAVGAADEVAHFHWSSDQATAWASLVFSGIKQHGCRIVAVLVGAP
jgi:hypothetical protein